MTERKYKKRWVGFKRLHGHNRMLFTYPMFRIVALRDIPEHGVKVGDLGGYVTNSNTLSHEGSCWIGDEAMVVGHVTITDDAYVGGTATIRVEQQKASLTIKDNARIFENATVAVYLSLYRKAGTYIISGNAQIFGNCNLLNVEEISGNAKIHGEASLGECSVISGEAEIFEKAVISWNCKVMGKSTIRGNAKVLQKACIKDTNLGGTAEVANKTLINGKVSGVDISGSFESLDSSTLKEVTSDKIITAPALSSSPILNIYHELLDSIASYETDIVKIIKYPVMTDRTDALTREMVVAMNNAKRNSEKPESADFKDAVRILENAFLTAESNARKIAATALSEEERKNTEKAKDLFRVAANEASTEHEKKVAFKQGFKQLEGVLDIPDIAVDTFRVKIGLKEIESGFSS